MRYDKIAGDLEIIQQETIKAVNVVEPVMVVKKKNGREIKVQDGWKGRILPFALVQKNLLSQEVQQIEAKQDRLQEIPSVYETILEELSEDDKELITDALNETNDAFVLKNVAAMIKQLKHDDAAEYGRLIAQLQKVDTLNKEEKALKKSLKADEIALHLRTKERIETMPYDQARILLQKKWIDPIYEDILSLSQQVMDALEKNILALAKKYDHTYGEIEEEITQTEAALSDMLLELTGSETDMESIREFQRLLGVKSHEK